MPHFAFIYHPTRRLDEAELARRAEVVRAWTLGQLQAGRIRQVVVFDDAAEIVGALERHHLPPAGVALLEVAGWDAARDLADSFPGREFGTAVEIRAVKVQAAAPAAG